MLVSHMLFLEGSQQTKAEIQFESKDPSKSFTKSEIEYILQEDHSWPWVY
jgi:hypothetical protein